MNLERIHEIAEGESFWGSGAMRGKSRATSFIMGRVAHCDGERMRRTGGTVHEP